jgi:hypothetical protein
MAYRELLSNLFVQIVDETKFTVIISDFINLYNEGRRFEEEMASELQWSCPLHPVNRIKKSVIGKCSQI